MAINNTVLGTTNGLIKPPVNAGSNPLFSTNYNLLSQYANSSSNSAGIPLNTKGQSLIPGVVGTNAFSSSGVGGTQTPMAPANNVSVATPPTGGTAQTGNNNASQIAALTASLNDAKTQLTAAQGAGYSGNQAIKYDANGNIIPANQLAAGGTQPNNNPYGNTSPTFSGAAGALANTAATSTPEYQAALKQYNDANQALAALGVNAAEQNADIQGSRTNLAEAGGGTGILQNLVANKAAALTGEMTAAQSAAQTATGQQAVQQTGLGNLAGLISPQQAGPTNVAFNPETGTYGPAAAGAYGNNNGSGLQDVGNISAQIGIGQNVGTMNAALGAAQTVGSSLSNLITQNNINPADPQFLNSMNQFLQTGIMSNPQYQQFYGTLQDYIASLAPILGVGGNVTDQKTSMAAQMVSQLASGSSIVDTIKYFDNLAQQKIQGYSQGGGVGSGASAGGNTGMTFGSFFGG